VGSSIYLGVTHGILTPQIFFERNTFWYTPTRSYWGYIITILYSEIRSRTVFFVIIYNRFVDSSKCGPRDFDPQSKKRSRSPGRSFLLYLSFNILFVFFSLVLALVKWKKNWRSDGVRRAIYRAAPAVNNVNRLTMQSSLLIQRLVRRDGSAHSSQSVTGWRFTRNVLAPYRLRESWRCRTDGNRFWIVMRPSSACHITRIACLSHTDS